MTERKPNASSTQPRGTGVPPVTPQTSSSSSSSDAHPKRELHFNTLPPPLPASPEFLARCRDAGIEFEPGDVEQLGSFLALLLEANQLVNLTAITDPVQAWERHIFDALTLLPLLADLPEGALIADVGSGGGLPAIPLAIVLPLIQFTLLEATGKKAAFLTGAIRLLNLPNARVWSDRAEAVGQVRAGKESESSPRAGRDVFDIVTARALGPLAVAAELTIPLAKLGGRVLLVKGQKADEELVASKRAIALVGAEHEGTLDTPTGRIVVLVKAKPTPRPYPRKPGEPKRAPL